MSDEKETEPAGTVIEEGIGKSNSDGNLPGSGEYQSSNHDIKMEMDVDAKDAIAMEVLVEVKAEMVDGGELKGLSEAKEEILEGEEGKGGDMGVEKKVNGCKRRFGVGCCKNSVENGEDLCLKHRRSENKKNKIESNKKSKVKHEEVEHAMNVKEEEKDEGESSMRKGEVLEKRERKKKATGKEGDGNELDVSGERVALGGRTGLRVPKKLNVDDEANYGADEACSGKTSSRRRKDPEIDFEKYLEEISENCHQCQRHDKGGVVRCKSCKKRRYCLHCADRW